MPRGPIFIYPVVCYRQTPGYHVYVLWVQNPPPPWPIQAAQTIRPECDLHTTVSKPVTSYWLFMLLAPPPVCTTVMRTCCQGQTGSLTVRPDRARWENHCIKFKCDPTNDSLDIAPTSSSGGYFFKMSSIGHLVFNGFFPKVNQIIKNTLRTTTSNLNPIRPTFHKISRPQAFWAAIFFKNLLSAILLLIFVSQKLIGSSEITSELQH